MSTRQADIGIWMRPPKKLNYIQKKLIDITLSYLWFNKIFRADTDTQKTLSELNKHKFISYGKGAPSPVFSPEWALKIRSQR